MRLSRLLALAGLVACAAVARGAGAQPIPARGSDVVFADGARLVLANSSTLQAWSRKRPFIARCDSAALSPDGSRVAFTRFDEKSGYQQLHMLSLKDGAVTQLGAATGWHRDPTWAPDGNRLLSGCCP